MRPAADVQHVTVAIIAVVMACSSPAAPTDVTVADVGLPDSDADTDLAAEASTTAQSCGTLDKSLRFDQIQALGSHNSYHVAKKNPVAKELDYTHSPFAVQFDQEGVRHVELDLFLRGCETGTCGQIEVEHIPGLDDGTRCELLSDCIAQLKTWSDAHPCHHLLVVLLELKDELSPDSKLEDHFAVLDDTIAKALPRHRLFAPDDLRGSAKDVRTAVRATGWRPLGETRGKFAFVMMDGDNALPNYRKLHPGGQGASVFVFGEPDEQDVAAVQRDNPTSKDIGELVKLGYIVRTYPNATELEKQAAFASGATLISTDYPVSKPRKPGFEMQLPGGKPSRCNPVSAPPKGLEPAGLPGCTTEAVNAGVG
jgi:hypothetical protein